MARAARLFFAFLPVCLLMPLAGCGGASSSSSTGGGGSTTPTPSTATLATGGAASVYVLQQNSNASGSVLQFSATATGTAATPAVTVPAPMGLFAQAVAVDSSGNIYIGGGLQGAASGGQIQISNPLNNIIRQITGTAAHPLGLPWSITVDSTGQVYVLTLQGAIYVYAAGAGGSIDPVKIITSTQIVTPLDIAVDTAGNIYVATSTAANTGSVLVFSSSASGANPTPARTITSANLFFSIAVDSSMNLYAAMNTVGTTSTSIAEYSANATGAATAAKTVSGTATGFSSVYASGLRLDAAGNLWVSLDTPIGSGNGRGNSIVEAFGPSVTGNEYPGATFSNTSVWTAGGTEIAVK